jgi:hypothetical protein
MLLVTAGSFATAQQNTPLYLPVVVQSQATSTPTTAPSPTATATVTPTTTPPTEAIANADFEQGPTVGWNTITNAQIVTPPAPLTARSGSFVALFTDDGADFGGTRALTQTITVPASAPILHIWTRVSSTEQSCQIESLTVRGVQPGTFEGAGIIRPVCRSTTSNEWLELTVDFSDYAGQTVELQLIFTSFNRTVNSIIIVDDLSFQAL